MVRLFDSRGMDLGGWHIVSGIRDSTNSKSDIGVYGSSITVVDSNLSYNFRSSYMKVLQGKYKLGEAGAEVNLDWDQLYKYRGGLRQQMVMNKWLGTGLRLSGQLLSFLALAGLVAVNELSIESILFGQHVFAAGLWGGVLMWVYATFLVSEDRYNFRRVDTNLREDRGSQEWQDYLDMPVWQSLDELYEDHDFLAKFSAAVLADKQVIGLLHRLGLPDVTEQLTAEVVHQPQSLGSNIPLLQSMWVMGLRVGAERMDMTTAFLALMENYWQEWLMRQGIPQQELTALQDWVSLHNRKQHYQRIWKRMSLLKPTGTVNRAYTSRYAATLEEYGTDLTSKAARGDFVMAIGKDQALLDLLRTLERQRQGAMLISDPGVGKSHLLEYLAVRMVVEDVPAHLKDKRLVAFDMPRAFTVSAGLENFKITLQKMFDEVASAQNVVLVLDNLDQALEVREDLRAEIANIVVSAVEQYALQVIGTASSEGFTKFIKPNHTLVNKFQVVRLAEPSAEVAQQILIDVSDDLMADSGADIEISAIRQVVKLAARFDHDRSMPDKGILLLEEAILFAREKGLNSVSAGIIDELVSQKVGVQVGQLSADESQRLLEMEQVMHQRVVGQEQAISSVARALRRSRAGLGQKQKPVASFLFFGPTGVGKTEVAKTLAEVYYGSENLMTRIDMSEYQEADNLQRLLGVEQNGEFTGGYLTEAVRTKPYSLILLDEIEKANPKVLDLLLQILDEGHLTDGMGRRIDFTNTIIIITSNAASRQIADLLGRGLNYHDIYKQVSDQLRQVFRVELLNRFDEVIMFQSLNPIEIQEVARRMLAKLTEKLLDDGYHFTYAESILEQLVQYGYNPIYGAREMRRAIRDHVEDKVAEAIVGGQLQPGGKFELTDI